MDEKITVKEIMSANVRMDNTTDGARAYDVAGTVNLSGKAVQRVDGGSVADKETGAQIATFTSCGDMALNIQHNTDDVAVMLAVTEAIAAFISDVKAKVEADGVSVFTANI